MQQPFEDAVRRHGATVLRVCRAVLPAADVDDVWSETFLAALRAWPDLPEDANVQAWLVTIAHRKAIDATRRARVRPVPVADLPESAVAPVEPHPELWTAVSALPDKQRRVVAYRYLGGLSYPEIAGLLGGTPEAARRAGADAVRNLRRHYPIGATDDC